MKYLAEALMVIAVVAGITYMVVTGHEDAALKIGGGIALVATIYFFLRALS